MSNPSQQPSQDMKMYDFYKLCLMLINGLEREKKLLLVKSENDHNRNSHLFY